MEEGKFWRHHPLRFNQSSTDIFVLKLLTLSLFLTQASFALDSEIINFNTMKASFIQTIDGNGDVEISKTKGHLVVKRPELMLWHIKEPTERIIIFESGSILIFDPDLNQVIKTDVNQYEEANWIKILMSDSELNKSYKQYTEGTNSHMFIKYKPLVNDSLMSTITIAMKENLIDSIDIEHSQRQKIHIDLMDIEMNKMIDDGFFSDLIPNDAEVIE